MSAFRLLILKIIKNIHAESHFIGLIRSNTVVYTNSKMDSRFRRKRYTSLKGKSYAHPLGPTKLHMSGSPSLNTAAFLLDTSLRALVSWVSFLKKRKGRQKIPIQQKLYLPRLLPPFSIQECRWPSLPSAKCQPFLFEFWRSRWISSFFLLVISFYIIVIL